MTQKRFTKGYHTIRDTKENKTYDFRVDIICNLLNELNDENKQLKSTIKKVIELLGEEVDVFSEKATEHDLNAYRELQQLDNKDAYYMATATKEAIKLLKGDVE